MARQMTEVQKENLAKGRAAAYAKRQAAKAANGHGSNGHRAAEPVEEVLDALDAEAEAVEAAEAAAAKPPPRVPRAEDIIRGGVFTPMDDVPPPELDAENQTGMTFGPIVDSSSGKLRTLDDIMAAYPIGDGQYYILVERKAPQRWAQLDCLGLQAPIRQQMTNADFVRAYGGGTYALIVYGPPMRGAGIIDPRTGVAREKALTEPIVVRVSTSIAAPRITNPDDDGSEDDMRVATNGATGGILRPGMSRGPATSADADMFKTGLLHEERAEERRIRLEAEERDRRQREGSERDQQISGTMQAAMERIDRAQERAQAEAQKRAEQEAARAARLEQELKEERKERDAKGTLDMNGLFSMFQQMTGSNRDGAATDRILSQHQEEMRRVTEDHRREVEVVRQQMRDIEKRADERVREAHESAKDEVRNMRDEARRQVEDAKAVAQQRLEDERRGNERDIMARGGNWESRFEAAKGTYEMRIQALDAEITRQRAELDKARADVVEAKDLPKRIAEIKETAEALGMQEGGSGGGDGGDPAEKEIWWQSLIKNVGSGLPGVVQSAIQMVGTPRPGAPAAPNAQAFSGMPPGMVPNFQPQQRVMTQPSALPGFTRVVGPMATEDGPPLPTGGGFEGHDAPPPRATQPIPSDTSVFYPPIRQQQQQMMPMPVMRNFAPPMMPQQQVQQAQPQMPALPQAQQSQAAQAASPLPPGMGDAIAQLKPVVEDAFAARMDPKQAAAALMGSQPQLGQMAADLTPELVAQALTDAGFGDSPLVMRDGQRWLGEVQKALQALQGR